ncbi:MAG: two pore domain potassium channel family protein [Algoriphagus sp.]|uniref:potassium channel family protein n=1 Tax=Algoriphagus sp. TaxID=1872435 RepID=UPI0017F3B642|nr:potassium channel family protein [Algoriphagus sp.]NVJ87600.1 two pore domain potassium channel family protein [Algoriphagus sp.]
MRYTLLGFCLLFSTLSFAQETSGLKEYSYSEFIEMIQSEDDTLFQLSNAKIFFNPQTDSLFIIERENNQRYTSLGKGLRKDTLHITKELFLENVQFETILENRMLAGFSKVKFHESVYIVNPQQLVITNSKIMGAFLLGQDDALERNERNPSRRLNIENSIFNGSLFALYSEKESEAIIGFRNNKIISKRLVFQIPSFQSLYIQSNDISTESFALTNQSSNGLNNSNLEVLNNSIEAKYVLIDLKTNDFRRIKLAKNLWNTSVIAFGVDDLSAKTIWINWDQFENKLIDLEMFREWMAPNGISSFDKKDFVPEENSDPYFPNFTEKNVAHYNEIVKVEDIDVYNVEQALKGKFYDFYKGRHEISAANNVYIEIKDLETQRLEYLYGESPSFKTFFKWRINQFLKVFSAYGTEPERAIVFSVYVILAFALIYLFFPNHWDSHGKNRIMDRYRFFLKYVNKDSGIHEVYLDEKKPALLASEDFKLYLEEQGKTAPKFFMATALPLYRWSVAGTKTFSWLLSKVDVLKGTWSSTEDSKKAGKSVLIIGAFLIAIVYDLFIKMLNALMLSINTFTTLGFGEIPIKGLPRYLAIIQGFIGWFMLTIFSVSLISQLLN